MSKISIILMSIFSIGGLISTGVGNNWTGFIWCLSAILWFLYAVVIDKKYRKIMLSEKIAPKDMPENTPKKDS